jgi:uncharacterized iron-regulated membrane protein
VVALPLLVVIVTGLLLQLKKELPWVQPPEQRGAGREPQISFAEILRIVRSIPEAEVRTWGDVQRLDVRPGRGVLKVVANNNYEIQIDTQTGQVLQVAYRRSDLIESMHDGSWFGGLAKLGVFLPAAVILLVLWLTGMYLFWHPLVVRRRRKATRAVPREQPPVAPPTPAAGAG